MKSKHLPKSKNVIDLRNKGPQYSTLGFDNAANRDGSPVYTGTNPFEKTSREDKAKEGTVSNYTKKTDREFPLRNEKAISDALKKMGYP